MRAGTGTEGERLELLRAHRQQVLDQLAEVTAHLGAIDRKIDIYLDMLAESRPLRRALDLERAPGA